MKNYTAIVLCILCVQPSINAMQPQKNGPSNSEDKKELPGLYCMAHMHSRALMEQKRLEALKRAVS